MKSLSFNTDENSLRGHFEKFGTMTKCKLLKGIAFVEYESAADAAKALNESNGIWLDDRQIWCEFSGAT